MKDNAEHITLSGYDNNLIIEVVMNENLETLALSGMKIEVKLS